MAANIPNIPERNEAKENLKNAVEEKRREQELQSAATCNRITAFQGDRILRRPEVESRCGLSRSSIYAKLDPKSPYHDATFPKPMKLGMRAVGWTETGVNAWLESRSQEAA